MEPFIAISWQRRVSASSAQQVGNLQIWKGHIGVTNAHNVYMKNIKTKDVDIIQINSHSPEYVDSSQGYAGHRIMLTVNNHIIKSFTICRNWVSI
jgi:hypothetical protein